MLSDDRALSELSRHGKPGGACSGGHMARQHGRTDLAVRRLYCPAALLSVAPGRAPYEILRDQSGDGTARVSLGQPCVVWPQGSTGRALAQCGMAARLWHRRQRAKAICSWGTRGRTHVRKLSAYAHYGPALVGHLDQP